MLFRSDAVRVADFARSQRSRVIGHLRVFPFDDLISFLLLRAIYEKATFAAALIATIVLDAAAIFVLVFVIKQNTESCLCAASLDIFSRSFIAVSASKVTEHSYGHVPGEPETNDGAAVRIIARIVKAEP